MAFKSYKFRLYPTKAQVAQLEQHCGSVRFVWNHMLAKNIESHNESGKFIFANEMQKELLELKKENTWLSSINSQSIQVVCRRMDSALKQSFKSNKNRKGFPKFKKKKLGSGSFAIPQNTRIEDKSIRIPKIGSIKTKIHRQPFGVLKSATISKDVDQWYISILFEQMDVPVVDQINNIVGIDLGIKEFATTSDGEFINYVHPRKLLDQIIFAQRKLSKKQKGSNNRKKQQIKLAKLHRKERNKRNDFHNKTANAITKHNDLVAVEDLNISGMVKNRKLAKSVSKQGWHSFITKLEQKCKSEGKYFVKINRFFPSSKTCSACGWVQQMPLEMRTYSCSSCGHEIDRDINAAINIAAEGRKLVALRQELPDNKPVEIA